MQLVPAMDSGGVERGVVELSRALAKENFAPLVVSSGGHLCSGLKSADVEHITLPVHSKNPITILCNIYRIASVARRYKVDIIHARSRAPAWSGFFAAKKVGCLFVTTVHGPYSVGGLLKKLYNSVMVRADLIIAVSCYVKDYIVSNYQVASDAIEVVHRGADTEYFNIENIPKSRMIEMSESLNIEHDKALILLPGRLTEWKGHEFLIDALAKIDKSKYTCFFLGKEKGRGSYSERIRSKIKQLGLQDNILILGDVRDMPAIYALSDIVVSASQEPEAFGRVAVEGQAMGRLVIATNHGGSCETVVDGKTGWLVEPGDVETLSNILAKLVGMSKSQRAKVAKSARQHVEKNFTIDKMTARTISLYEKILKKRKQ